MIFCDLEQVLSKAWYRDLLFDYLLELSKTRSSEISKNKTQNRISKGWKSIPGQFLVCTPNLNKMVDINSKWCQNTLNIKYYFRFR